jgi:hypothetical protein
MNSFIASLWDALWEDAHTRNFNNRYYHHTEKCGQMIQDDQTKGSGNNVYKIRRRLCVIHNVFVGESGWEFGIIYGTVSKSMNPPDQKKKK